MIEFYPWIKALHVMSIIAWMAGLLYLPRLFVYHCTVAPNSEAAETFKVMERRLLRGIMNPSMIAAYLFGISLIALNPALMKEGWLHAKILFVLLMTAVHMMAARWRRDFEVGRNRHSERYYRVMNEVPALLMAGIVIFVIVRPF